MVRCALKVAAEQNPWTKTNHPEHLALQHNSPCGRVYLTTPLTDAAVTSCLCAADRQIHVLWCWLTRRCSAHALSLWETGHASSLGVIYWFGPGAVFFTEGKVNPFWVMQKRHTLWSGNLNYFKGVSILNCHPTATFALGMQYRSCWSQQYSLNVNSAT